jgi:hypothetical protein
MRRKPPVPLCKAFLVLSQIVDGSNGEVVMTGLPRCYHKHVFPSATPIAFFARLTSAHGEYKIEMQLQNPQGETVWRDGPPEPWILGDPLELYDLKLKMCASFPNPGQYDFVLVMNGEEVARQSFPAVLATPG